MNKSVMGTAAALILLSAAMAPAQAQLLNQLQGAVGGGATGSGGVGSGLAIPSVNQASTGNLAGVLQYCVRNNYLSGGSASSVEQSLMGRTRGGTQDSGFTSGSQGILQSGSGQGYSLGGSGIKQQVTRKVCDQVLQHGKSLL